MSAVFSPVQKVADKVIGIAEDIVSPILGEKNAAMLSDPLGLKQPEAPPAAAAPAATAPAADTAAADAAAASKTGAAATELAPASTKAAAVDESKTEPAANSFAVRQSMNIQRAAAAGATKTANDADLLGYVAPKKKSASRAILG